VTIALPAPERARETETTISRAIRRDVGRIPGLRLARNNTGILRDERGIPIRFGLGDGSPDLVGLITFGGAQSCDPTLDLPLPLALAFGLEVKVPGKRATRQQQAWHLVADRRGMLVQTVTSSAEAVVAVHRMIATYRSRLRNACGSLSPPRP
jgi:hypothetical protein